MSRLAGVNRPVLVLGERGTGKELVAERLHYLSGRWDGPLLKLNCAAIAESLLESELFGHEAGAFTGATRIRRVVSSAPKAAVCSSMKSQPCRCGCRRSCCVSWSTGSSKDWAGQETLRADVRVIAATNVDLQQRAAQDLFRSDLLDRLSFDVVHLPALRQRSGDIYRAGPAFRRTDVRGTGLGYVCRVYGAGVGRIAGTPLAGQCARVENVVERSLYRWGDPRSLSPTS